MDPFVSGCTREPHQHAWTDRMQSEPPRTALDSPLLELVRTSDVDPLLPDQIEAARRVLRNRRALVSGREDLRGSVLADQRTIVERFLERRRQRFGRDQSRPLPDIEALLRDDCDVFVVVKFMDEAPHLEATLDSLANQDIDPRRVVVLTVDNRSTDASGEIARNAAARHPDGPRFVPLEQATPGAGHAARFGVDTAIATIYEMCRRDGRWSRLQRATVAVSDGDTVYHPSTLSVLDLMLRRQPTADAVMPFLTYKFTAALRLFAEFRWTSPEDLRAAVAGAEPVRVPFGLSTATAHGFLPRSRRLPGEAGGTVTTGSGESFDVPWVGTDPHGRRVGVLSDADGNRAYLLDDRNLVLDQAPVSGVDAALVFLENRGVRREEKWRWHSVVGHDLFLMWSFRAMGLPEEMVFPDTSDALKTVRAWAFAVGGQHQLQNARYRIATGSDYQSGRVLQAIGCTVRLAPAHVYAETETDRLMKMVRNFVNEQAVFYGGVRGEPMDRATGLYLHMTRIQTAIEAELRGCEDSLFESTVFPERVLFPLRWMLQNAIRFALHGDLEEQIVELRVMRAMFTPRTRVVIRADILTDAVLDELRQVGHTTLIERAERLAEQMIGVGYVDIMGFYQRTLRSFFEAHDVESDAYDWLLQGMEASHNAVLGRPQDTDPAAVWASAEFRIDTARGQVTAIGDVVEDAVR